MTSCQPDEVELQEQNNCPCFEQTVTFDGDGVPYETQRIPMPEYRCELSDPNTYYQIPGTTDFVYRFINLCN
jgi:hypothetical protein